MAASGRFLHRTLSREHVNVRLSFPGCLIGGVALSGLAVAAVRHWP
jgi:hypothetical protein